MPDRYPEDWDSRRRKVYQRDNYTCQNCGVKGGSRGNAELHAHHQVPKSKGGSHNLDNLTTLCSRCHDAVHEGGIASPKVSLGSWKRHTIYLFTTFGIGNILHLTNSIWKSYKQRRAINKRLRRAKYGSLKIHVLLFFTTAGIGNLLYYLYKNPTTKISNSNELSTNFNISTDPRSNVSTSSSKSKSDSFNWHRAAEYPYDSYYEATDEIKRLKRESKHDEVEDLLMWCINFAEAESRAKNQTLPRAYYRHLAIVYRKDGQYDDEVEILERYVSFCKNMGDPPRKEITNRLERAKELAEQN